MRFLIIAIVFFCTSSLAVGQGNNISSLMKSNMAKADQFYNYLDYRNAQYYYYKVLDKEPSNSKARLRIAECYLKLDDSASALEWLDILAEEPDADTGLLLMYADVLKMNEKYDLAAVNYRKVLDQHGYNENARLKLGFLENIDFFTRNPNLYHVDTVSINSEQSDFAPQLKGSDFIFVSSRRQDILVQYQPATAHNDTEVMLKYFRAHKDSLSQPGSVSPLSYGDALKSKFHDGPLWFYNQGRNVAFTRNNAKVVQPKGGGRLINLEIFFANSEQKDAWTGTEAFPYNNDDYSVGHPTMNSSHSAMYFASNKPGSRGGSDIYVSYWENGKWQEPQNLGGPVNTVGDEFYPYLKNDSTLFFVSTGHGGFGGMDLFVAYARKGVFGDPVNLGAPLNSAQDDFSILFDKTGRGGYFASNRPGGKGLDDIYSFSAPYYFVTGWVTDLLDSTSVVPNVQLEVRADGIDPIVLESDANGMFQLDLPFDKNYLISAKKQGYTLLEEVGFSTADKTMGYDTLTLRLWKHGLYAKGRVFSNESQAVLEGAKVTILDIETQTKDSLVTGADGNYSWLVHPERKYRIEASKDSFISNGFNLNTSRLLQGELLNDILLEEDFVDKATVFFEFNESKFSTESYPELSDILKTLRRFPESTLNITAHADSRGTVEYNQKLSDRRVVAVLNYFTSRGIKKSRIKGKGFGEELHLNECSDGVECPEEDHSQNRRAEIKVQMSHQKQEAPKGTS